MPNEYVGCLCEVPELNEGSDLRCYFCLDFTGPDHPSKHRTSAMQAMTCGQTFDLDTIRGVWRLRA